VGPHHETRVCAPHPRTANSYDESNRLIDAVAQLRDAEEKAAFDLRTQDTRAAQATDQLKAKRLEIGLVQS